MDPRQIFERIRQTETPLEYTFAFEIAPDVVKGAIWAIDDQKAKTFSVSPPISWQNGKLLEAADRCFSLAVEKAALSQEDEPKKVMFGLPYSWVEGDKIVSQKLSLLKNLCQSLDLKPVGFVVVAEAIVSYLETIEGLPPNAILVQIGISEAEITLLRLGKIIGRAVVGRSENLGEDVAEGLSRIKSQEVLPARMILYNGQGEIEEKKEEILTYPWLAKESSFNFLHLPKVEVVSAEFDIKAVALAGGAEIAKAKGIKAEIFTQEEKENSPSGEKASFPETSEEGQRPLDKDREEDSTPDEARLLLKSDSLKKSDELDFGFVKEKDITLDQVNEEKKVVSDPARLAKKSAQKPKLAFLKRLKRPKIKLSRVNFKNFFSGIRRQRLPFLGAFLLVFFLLLGGALFWFWWFFPKAEITLFVKPQTLEKEFEIILDADAEQVDIETMTLPAKLMERDLKSEEEQDTTGTKLVGEKAGGEVMIYNRTLEEKTLKPGTVLIGPSGLEFSLSETVIVASESSGPDYVRIPGKASVRVSATAIGAESNLASGTEFEIDKYSRTDLVARNDSAFSGGSSREIKIVSEKDQEKLAALLLNRLRERAIGQLEEEISAEDSLIGESLTEEILAKSFDRQAGEEANQLRLVLEIRFKALAYQKDQLTSLVREKIKKAVSSGFEFKEEESEVDFKLEKILDKGRVVFAASFKAILWPKIDVLQIRENLRGKEPETGEFYLNSLPNLAGFEVLITPNLPSGIKTFPRVADNIQIELKSR
ncbi:MAG: hypothetical protein JW991_04575 [Candidatus Pacebacteria bacterium]|nr:hypothetical protein [Candidatus Paceibacterota bacterium]